MQTTRSHPPCRSRASLTRRSTLSVRPRCVGQGLAVRDRDRVEVDPLADGVRRPLEHAQQQLRPAAADVEDRAGVAVGQERHQP